MTTRQPQPYTNEYDVIQIGYEIASCNDEGYTDFDEAVRIFAERNPHIALADDDIIAMLPAWEREFPNGIAR
jgi:hypothetical protein